MIDDNVIILGDYQEDYLIKFLNSYLENKNASNFITRSTSFSTLLKSDIDTDINLIDFRNSLFMSEKKTDLLEFYNSFENKEQIIEWMKNRPKGNTNLVEVEGSKNIVVVIPTMDSNSSLSQNVKYIYHNLQIIFVESGYNNKYFNYADSCNIGIKKASEYNPDWIIISNDDMILKDGVEVLINEINKNNPNTYDVLYTLDSNYHSIPSYVCKLTPIFLFLQKIINPDYGNLLKKFEVNNGLIIETLFNKDNTFKKIKFSLLKNVLTKKVSARFVLNGSFAIIGKNVFGQKSKLFDDTYINHNEDVDLCLSLLNGKNRYNIINYDINEKVGTSLGYGEQRKLRGIIGDIYLFTKFKFD